MARPVSGKSLQTMKATLIKDLKLDDGVGDVLTKLLDPSDEDADGLILDKKTKHGDTILHSIVHATVDLPGNMKYYMQIVDKICARSAEWWTKYSNKDDGTSKASKFLGMAHLLEKSKDKEDRNVWDLSIELVAIDMIEKLMYLEDVTVKHNEHWNPPSKIFAVSNFIDMKFSVGSVLKRSFACFWKLNDFEVKLQPLLQQTKAKNKIDDLLRVKPIQKITDIVCQISTVVYIMVVFLHIVYMSLFSYLGCELMDARNPTPTIATLGLIYSFGLVEPILLTFYLINQIARVCKEDTFSKERRNINYFWELLWFVIILVYNVFLWEVIASVGSEITATERNILSFCLLLGWLLTFALADGIRQIHFFFKLIIRVMFRDVLRILGVYIIFLLGFSLSIHAQFISSANITMTYETPFHTMFLMFNVMVGMDEAVDETTEAYLEAVNVRPLFSKLLYIGYVLCATIVLLNLLIAMMNTSYATIEVEHMNEWVFNAAHFGTKVLTYFPGIANFLGASKIKKQMLFEYSKPVWTIEVSNTDTKSDDYQSKAIKYTDKDLRTLGYEIEHSEKILKAQLFEMKRSQSEIMKCIENLQARVEKLSQDLLQSGSRKNTISKISQ